MISVGRSVVRLNTCEGARQHFLIVGVAHARDVPAVADEARRDVVAERERGVAFDA